MSNIYYWEKLKFSKLQFSRKENLKKCTSFEEQKGTLSSSAIFRLQNRVSDFFYIEIKGFYQCSLGNEIDFRDMMNVSTNFLAKN